MPASMKLFNRMRPRDINFEAAVANEARELTYYMFGHPALNSFDYNLVKERIEKHRCQLIAEKKIVTRTLKQVLGETFPKIKKINFRSIDVEGFDLEVDPSNDWKLFRTEYVLVECYGSTKEENQSNPIYTYFIKQIDCFFGKAVFTLIFKDKILKK
jgi:hypothetical protein